MIYQMAVTRFHWCNCPRGDLGVLLAHDGDRGPRRAGEMCTIGLLAKGAVGARTYTRAASFLAYDQSEP